MKNEFGQYGPIESEQTQEEGKTRKVEDGNHSFKKIEPEDSIVVGYDATEKMTDLMKLTVNSTIEDENINDEKLSRECLQKKQRRVSQKRRNI